MFRTKNGKGSYKNLKPNIKVKTSPWPEPAWGADTLEKFYRKSITKPFSVYFSHSDKNERFQRMIQSETGKETTVNLLFYMFLSSPHLIIQYTLQSQKKRLLCALWKFQDSKTSLKKKVLSKNMSQNSRFHSQLCSIKLVEKNACYCTWRLSSLKKDAEAT